MNSNNYAMLSRSLKEDKQNYINNFKQANEARSSQTAFTFESIGAPFIEQGSIGLLKKGVGALGKGVGLSDETIQDLTDVGENIRKGNIKGALDKATTFANDKINRYTSFKTNPDVLDEPIQMRAFNSTDFSVEPETDDTSVFSILSKQLDNEIPRVSTNIKTSDIFSTLSQSKGDEINFGMLPKIENRDAFSGTILSKAKAVIKNTIRPQVLDENGNPQVDENDKVRNKLDYIDEKNSTATEIEQNKRELSNLIGETQAPEETSTYQSAMSFLKGDKGSASANWGRKPAEMDEISNFRPTNEPLINPRDVAPDIKVPERSDYFRRGNIRVSSKPLQQRIKPDVGEAGAEDSVRDTIASRDRTITNPVFDNEIPADIKEDVVEPKGLGGEEIDRILGQNNSMSVDRTITNPVFDSTIFDKEEPEPQPDNATEQPKVEATEAPAEADESESLGKTILKGVEDVGTDVVEGGGIENPLTDVIALGAGLATLFGGLAKAHASSPIPSIKQINPSFQLGVGQE